MEYKLQKQLSAISRPASLFLEQLRKLLDRFSAISFNWTKNTRETILKECRSLFAELGHRDDQQFNHYYHSQYHNAVHLFVAFLILGSFLNVLETLFNFYVGMFDVVVYSINNGSLKMEISEPNYYHLLFSIGTCSVTIVANSLNMTLRSDIDWTML